MKTPKQLLIEFNNMTLGKQSLIAVATIILIVAVLSNYKNIKHSSKEVIDKITKDENIQEFMLDVDKVVKSFVNVVNKFFKGEQCDK